MKKEDYKIIFKDSMFKYCIYKVWNYRGEKKKIIKSFFNCRADAQSYININL